jgi:hypothetical protein
MIKRLLPLIAVYGAIVAQSQAQITQAFSPAALPTTDSIGWGQMGSTFSQFNSAQNVTSGGGINATVNDAGSLFQRLDEDNGWAGNFSPGDNLLWTEANGPLTIDFATALYGAGAQIQQNDYGSFTAVITAYDGAVLLGSESINGVSNDNDDGSAVFIGLHSPSADITSVVFSLSAGSSTTDFAINKLDLSTKSSVPDAGSTSCLLGLSFLGCGFLRRKLAAA